VSIYDATVQPAMHVEGRMKIISIFWDELPESIRSVNGTQWALF
jgi:hypothetical protein